MSEQNQTATSEENGTYQWIESTYEDSRILQFRVGLDAACSYAEADARDAEISRVLTASRAA